MREAGFTLVEVAIGAAIAALVTWGLVTLSARLAAAASSLDARLVTQAAADRLIERLSSDAASAWTVSAPSPDEIDFFAEDGSHRPLTWSYRYDAASRIVTRSSGEAFGPFTSFVASAAEIGDLWNPASTAYDPLFAGSSATSVPGNALVVLHLAGSGVDRTEPFASGSAPTTFTVVVTYTPSPAPAATPTPVPLR